MTVWLCWLYAGIDAALLVIWYRLLIWEYIGLEGCIYESTGMALTDLA